MHIIKPPVKDAGDKLSLGKKCIRTRVHTNGCKCVSRERGCKSQTCNLLSRVSTPLFVEEIVKSVREIGGEEAKEVKKTANFCG